MKSKRYADELVLVANQNLDEREYWLNRLAGEWEKTHFPYDFHKRADHRPDMGRFSCCLSPGLAGKSWKLAGGVDFKLHIILLTGLMALLHRYTGTRDITVGSPVLRQEQDSEFINTILVFRQPLPVNLGFKDFLLSVRETVVGATENQDFPLAVLADLLGEPAGNEDFTLFDVGLMLESIHERDYLRAIDDRYDMLFCFSGREEEITCTVEYDAGLYREETVQRIAAHFQFLLESGLSEPELPLDEIDILSGAERGMILQDFNDTALEFPNDWTVPAMFAGQVAKTPDRIAIVGANGNSPLHGSVSYKELDRRASVLAGELIDRGVMPNTIVALQIGRSIEMIIGILGILKAGGAYLPIDPEAPAERVQYMLADSGAEIVIGSQACGEEQIPAGAVLSQQSPSLPAKTVLSFACGFTNCGLSAIRFSMPVPGIAAAHRSADSPRPSVGEGSGVRGGNPAPTDLAYVIYTSGSTGRPKGVLVEQRNLATNIVAFLAEFQVKPDDTVLQQASYTFDAFAEEVFPVLVRGGRLAIPTQTELLDIDLLVDFILRHQVNIIDCSPLLLNELNKSDRLSCLHTVISGGDVLKPAYVDRFLKSARVYNTYGPTESTVCVTYYRCPSPMVDPIPIGKPIANYRVYILDAHHRPHPLGVAGEIWVGGGGVARGYLNNPELSAERFVGGLYRTGDLGRWLADGNIEFLGRLDAQVKIRGYRIELGEVENRLLQHEHVGQAVVVPRKNREGENYLCAYVVAKNPGQNPGTSFSSQLRDFLWTTLPDYMVPEFFVELERLPVTASGKLDKRALPEPTIGGSTAYVAPGNGMEKTLVGIWADVLAIEPEKLGIDDDFFDLGGNSLKAIVISSKIHQVANVKVLLADIFREKTIRRLAGQIGSSGKDRYVPIEPAPSRDDYPLSSAQKRLFFLQQLEPETTSYNMPMKLVFKGTVDVGRFEESFKKLIDRHEVLRTSFIVVDGYPRQRVHAQVAFGLDYFQADENRAQEIARNFVRPFDLKQAPLVRAALVDVKDAGHSLLLVDMHHIVSDGWSHAILEKDFVHFFQDEGQLPRLPIQYKDFSEWQNSPQVRTMFQGQQAFWEKEFAGQVPVLNIETDYPRPAIMDFAGDAVQVRLEPEEVLALRRSGKELGISLQMLMLTAFYILLFKVTGQADIVVGTSVSGRRQVELEGVIGMFANTLALRNYPSGDKRVLDFLEEVKENCLAAYENQDFPFEELVSLVLPGRDASRNPLFDVMFEVQATGEEPGDRATPGKADPEERPIRYDLGNKTAKIDLDWLVYDRGASLILSVAYMVKIYKKETVTRLIGRYREVLKQVLFDPRMSIKNIVISHDFQAARSGFPGKDGQDFLF